jgi:GH24 family phage-related lysozyme (muramidase)
MPSNFQKVVGGLVIGGAGVITAMNQWERPPAERTGGASVVYADKLAGGLPTVCSGHTDWKMRVGTAYSKEECDSIDAGEAAKVSLAIIKCSGHTDTNRVLNQNHLDSLTLMGENVGAPSVCASNALRLIKMGLYAQGCDAIAHTPSGQPNWSFVTNGKGQKVFVQGLYNRRLFERDWCLRKPLPAPSTEVKTA